MFKLLNKSLSEIVAEFNLSPKRLVPQDNAQQALRARVFDELGMNESDAARIDHLLATTSEPLDQILIKLSLATEAELYEAYARIFAISLASVDDLTFNHREFSLNLAFLENKRLALATYRDDLGERHQLGLCVNPFDVQARHALDLAVGKALRYRLLLPSLWESARRDFEINEHDDESTLSFDLNSDVARLKDMASGEPVIRRVNHIISNAIQHRASDIHLEPQTRQSKIKYRVDGVLEEYDTLQPELALAVVSRIKILSGLDIAERRLPQDGRFSFPVDGRDLDIRVSSVPADFGESLVLRLLDKGELKLDFSHLGFTLKQVETIQRCTHRPNGLFLITGPTGSGKTTTLYTLLEQLKKQNRKILTIEDPIEYRLDGIAQSQVKPDIGYSFASALRAYLRHDPDVIMVGEIRDLETAEIAIQAALTGHLVLSTLHTNDAPSAIFRLLDMGVDDFLLGATLSGVLAQRLVRKRDLHGRSKYRGRTVLTELLEIDASLRPLIKQGTSHQQLVEKARLQGYETLYEDGLNKVKLGLSTEEDLVRVCGVQREENPCGRGKLGAIVHEVTQ